MMPAPVTTGEIAPYITLSNIYKSYDGQSFVVQDLNIGIRKGEFLTFLGPSGSGKTTTLMMLAGFEYPSQGEIRFGGRSVEGLPPEKRDIGVVFQNYALFPNMTIAQNIAYPLKVRRRPKQEISERVRDALRVVQLEKFADRKPSALSGGQQQRVALARALVFEPQLVLMDEPLGALDKKLREDLQLEIKHICTRFGLTVVYVTHDQGEALTMSDRIAVFQDGLVQQIATPREIYSNPVNAFVASFIGDNNCLEAECLLDQDGCAECRLPGGQRIVARSPSRLSPGAEAVVTVRPENIRIGSCEGANNVEGLVRDLVYHGDQFKVHIEIAGGQTIVGKIPIDSRSNELGVDAPVSVCWSQEDAIAFGR